MSKSTGLGWTTLSVDDNSGSAEAIKNDVTNFQFATPRGVQDVTGVDKFAFERLLLLADFSITLNGVANFGASPSEFDVFKTVSASAAIARTVTLVISSKTLANEVLFTDHAYNRGQDGSLTFTAPGVLADGTVPAWS